MLTQLWDGRQVTFLPESELRFFGKDLPFLLEFKRHQGAITSVLAFNRDIWVKDDLYR